MKINQKQFKDLVAEAVARTPQPYKDRLQNVAFIVENQPSPAQRRKLQLRADQTLFGLYEGTPLPRRGGQTKLLPDKSTILTTPLLAISKDKADLADKIGRTVWHEVAHYFGLDHRRIYELDNSGRAAGASDPFRAPRDKKP